MIPTALNYHKVTSISDALSLLQQHGDGAKLLAGGHSLLPALKLRLNQVDHLIDIAGVDDLQAIQVDSSRIVLGAGVTHHDIATSAEIKNVMPILAEAAETIGDISVRNFGTIGGSLAHADPAADWPAVLLACDATIVVQSSAGQREIAAADFFDGFYSTTLADDEIITSIEIPVPSGEHHSAYAKFEQPASRFAIVGCAVCLIRDGDTCQDINLAFTGVADMAFRDTAVESALKGQMLSADNIANAANQAATAVEVLSDHFATEGYRRHLAKVYAKRAISAAIG